MAARAIACNRLRSRPAADGRAFFVYRGNFQTRRADIMNTPHDDHARRIEIYDTTLRDGTQGEGFNLSLQDKLSIAKRLDELGVDYVEGGFPLSNPKDAAYFRDVRQLRLRHAKVAAFGMTRRRGMKAEEDPGMKALLEAETPVITIVGKTSLFQVEKVLNVSL